MHPVPCRAFSSLSAAHLRPRHLLARGRFSLTLPLILAACAQPEPIYDASVYVAGKAGLTTSPIPMARPEISATRLYPVEIKRGKDRTRAIVPEKPEPPQNPRKPKKECQR